MDDRQQYEKVKLILIEYFTKELWDTLRVAPQIDFSLHQMFNLDEIAMRIKYEIVGLQYKVATVSYPADWWQAFKDRWFPTWVKRRWPVKMVTKTIQARELYPKEKLIPGAEIRLHVFDRDETEN